MDFEAQYLKQVDFIGFQGYSIRQRNEDQAIAQQVCILAALHAFKAQQSVVLFSEVRPDYLMRAEFLWLLRIGANVNGTQIVHTLREVGQYLDAEIAAHAVRTQDERQGKKLRPRFRFTWAGYFG